MMLIKSKYICSSCGEKLYLSFDETKYHCKNCNNVEEKIDVHNRIWKKLEEGK